MFATTSSLEGAIARIELHLKLVLTLETELCDAEEAARGDPSHNLFVKLQDPAQAAFVELQAVLNYLYLFELVPPTRRSTARKYLKLWFEAAVKRIDSQLAILGTISNVVPRGVGFGLDVWAARVRDALATSKGIVTGLRI